MQDILLMMALSCCGLAAAGCAPALPAVEASPPVPGLGIGGKRVDASFQAAETACRAEEKRLRAEAESGASTRRVAETLLALGAGSLAVGAAIYAGLDPTPKGYVIVPLTVGAAAGTVPLGVLIATEQSDAAVDERQERIRDRRLAVREAYHRLAEATADRERAEAALAETDRRFAEQRQSEARGPIEDADRAGIVGIDAGRGTMLDARRAELTYARQREQDAERSLSDALLRLGEVCGR
jgi:hypothetical protein